MSLITLFTLICVCIIVYAAWTIKVSRQKQTGLLSEFKKPDQSLTRSNIPLQKNSPGVGAITRTDARLPEVELAIKASVIIRCIDSLKHELAMSTNPKGGASFSNPDRSRLLALKNNLAGYNAFIQKEFPQSTHIKPGDLINVDDVSAGSAAVPWEIYYFTNSSVFSMITELTFIKNQVLMLRQRAIN